MDLVSGFALVAGGCVGFYDGFFGPGAGSFYALAFVMLSGYNLATATATAHAKVLNFTSNFGGLMLFVLSGKVIWAVGLVMLAVSLLMSIKLIYDNHGAAIAHWLAVWL